MAHFGLKMFVSTWRMGKDTAHFSPSPKGNIDSPLGNCAPRLGYSRKPFCPVCCHITLTPQPNCEFHLAFECRGVAALRASLGVTSYFNKCRLGGLSSRELFVNFLGGRDPNGEMVEASVYLARGDVLASLRKQWLDKWQ